MAQHPDYVTITAEVPRARQQALLAAKKTDGVSNSLRIDALIALWERDKRVQASLAKEIEKVQAERRLAAQRD